jgi:hypothetical protein
METMPVLEAIQTLHSLTFNTYGRLAVVNVISKGDLLDILIRLLFFDVFNTAGSRYPESQIPVNETTKKNLVIRKSIWIVFEFQITRKYKKLIHLGH